MTISSKLQFSSNMLRRLVAFLVLGGGLIAICSCEPANRKFPRRAPVTDRVGCDHDGEGGACGTAGVVSPKAREDAETRTGRQARQEHADEEARKKDGVSIGGKKDKGYGKILLYMIGGLKAALIYGLLHGVAALAGKALLIAKIAMALAIAALLKKNEPESTSYEIVRHPHHSYVQTHSSSVDYDHRHDYDHRNDYDHRHDYGDYGYDHRKRRRIFR